MGAAGTTFGAVGFCSVAAGCDFLGAGGGDGRGRVDTQKYSVSSTRIVPLPLSATNSDPEDSTVVRLSGRENRAAEPNPSVVPETLGRPATVDTNRPSNSGTTRVSALLELQLSEGVAAPSFSATDELLAFSLLESTRLVLSLNKNLPTWLNQLCVCLLAGDSGDVFWVLCDGWLAVLVLLVLVESDSSSVSACGAAEASDALVGFAVDENKYFPT